MFLRIAFASWHRLPFFMEARAKGKRVFFGHMGIVDSAGRAWRNTPRFAQRFADYSDGWHEAREWPKDDALRGTKIRGKAKDQQTAFGGSPAGTYFDEVFLNKRVGYFLTIQLAYLGSVNLADSANTFNLRANALAPGDFLVERFAARGIGHTVVIKEVNELGVGSLSPEPAPQFEVDVISGSMPRRQGVWEGPTAARFYFLHEDVSGERGTRFGAGLKRFRSPVQQAGRWTNVVLPKDVESWINSNHHEELASRLDVFAEIIVRLGPLQRMQALLEKIERERAWLREHPASCAARTRREMAWHALYEAGEELQLSKHMLDREYRTLEDYVFTELSYDESKTCCWNTSTASDYQVVMRYNRCLLGEGEPASCLGVGNTSEEACQSVEVFKAVPDSGKGFARFQRFAEANDLQWSGWQEDENCPQASDDYDVEMPSPTLSYCDVLY
jgi:hypothetical protein